MNSTRIALLGFVVAFLSLLSSCELLKGPENNDSNVRTEFEPHDSNPINITAYANQAEADLVQTMEITGEIEADTLVEVCGSDTVATTIIGRSNNPDGGRLKARTILTVNFGNFRCEGNNIVRTGQVILDLKKGSNIAERGSVADFIFNNFKVEDTETGKFVVYNGTKTITNISGGALTDLGFGDPIIEQDVAFDNLTIQYSESADPVIRNTRRRKIFQKLEFGNNFRMEISPDTAVDGFSNVADWGILQNGKKWYNIVEETIIYESCQRRCKYVDGVKVRVIENGRELTEILGVDNTGEKVSSDCDVFGKLQYYINAKGDTITNLVKYQ